MNNKLISLWPNLSRAIEIALVGDYPVTVRIDPDYTEGQDDYQAIKESLVGIFENWGKGEGLNVEIVKPNTYDIHPRGEDIQDVLDRVKSVSNMPYMDDTTKEASITLMEVASDRLSLSIKDITFIHQVSKSIALLGGHKTIQTEDTAEAIHYSIKDVPLAEGGKERELLTTFVKEVQDEFKDIELGYLDFIVYRFLNNRGL